MSNIARRHFNSLLISVFCQCQFTWLQRWSCDADSQSLQ